MTPVGYANENGDDEALRERLRKAEAELRERNQYVQRLEKANRDLQQRVQEASESSQPTAELNELEEALKRLVARIAMILQAEKCVFMIHGNKAADELAADSPALGFGDEDLKSFQVSDQKGVSGEVYRENRAVILYDAATDERAIDEKFDQFGIRNGVSVPLIVEKKDDEGRLTDRKTIGVLHVFNKRYGNMFIEEDVHLLERLAKNAASIINTAETYRKVVHEKEELVETIESLYAGLVMVNKNGRVTQMNASAREIFGLSQEDLAGGKAYDAVITDEKVREVLRRALEEETGVAEEVTLPDRDNPDQQHIFQVQSALVRNESGDTIGTAAIFNDITEIRNVDKMKTAFVSTVSHELRTPLTSIKGFISTLIQDTEGFYDTATRHEFYTIIDTECDRLTRLITDLLNVSRIESGRSLQLNLKDVNLPELAEKVIRAQKSYTTKHTLSIDLDSSLPFIEADEDKMDQILTNLVNNAIKYSPKGGNVTVSAKMMGPELMRLAVTDEGMGIPKEQLGKMFQRFHRVDNRDTREIGGTGIGLFLVKNLVETHHGKIWIESEVGKGTTFFFTLPLKQPEEEEGSGQDLASRVAG